MSASTSDGNEARYQFFPNSFGGCIEGLSAEAEIVGCRVGMRTPRLEIVGKSDNFSINLDQFLVKLS